MNMPLNWIVVRGQNAKLYAIYDPEMNEKVGIRFAFGNDAIKWIQTEELKDEAREKLAAGKQGEMFG